MVTTDPESPVDDSPIVVNEIVVDEHRLITSEPLVFAIEFKDDPTEPLYALEGEFDIILAAPSRRELEEMLEDEFAFLWKHFALAEPTNLSPAARRLGDELRNRFRHSADAA